MHGTPGGSLEEFDEQVHEVIQGYAAKSGMEFHAKYGQRTVMQNGQAVIQYGAAIQTIGSHVASFGVRGPKGFDALKDANGNVRTMHNHGGSGMPANELDLLAMPEILRPGTRLRPVIPGQDLDTPSKYDKNPNGLLSHPNGIERP